MDMGFRYGNNEKVIREYNAIKMIYPAKMNGKIIVTDKRVILHGEERSLLGGSRSKWINDVHLDDIMGVDVFLSRKISWIAIFIGILSSIGGIFLISDYVVEIGLALVFIGIISLLFATTKSFRIEIKSAHVNGIVLGARGKKYQIMGIKPGPDAEILTSELGGLILDIKESGEDGFNLNSDKQIEPRELPSVWD